MGWTKIAPRRVGWWVAGELSGRRTSRGDAGILYLLALYWLSILIPVNGRKQALKVTCLVKTAVTCFTFCHVYHVMPRVSGYYINSWVTCMPRVSGY